MIKTSYSLVSETKLQSFSDFPQHLIISDKHEKPQHFSIFEHFEDFHFEILENAQNSKILETQY